MSPLVSVITPSFNCAKYIENTILKIQNQTYQNIEHIIIDGGSNDNTIEILKKYKDKITWISEKDSGMYDAINKGFKMARGEILTYINTDDFYESDRTIEIVVDKFKEHKNIDFSYGHCSFVDENGKFMYTYKAPKFMKEYSIAFPRGTFAQPTCFWRRKVHTSFDDNLQYVADAKFFRYLCKNYTGFRINEIIANFTIRADCISFENLEELKKENDDFYKFENTKKPKFRFILIDIFYRMIFLNFRTNIKRKTLQFLGKPYL